MKYEDAAAVLAKIQAYDGRNVSSANVAAWHEALGEVGLEDALAAVTEHFQDSTEWLMPVHIVKRVKDREFQGRQRLKEIGPVDFPSGLHQGEEREYRRYYQRAVFRGKNRDEAHREADFRFLEHVRLDLGGMDGSPRVPEEQFRSLIEGWAALRRDPRHELPRASGAA